MSVSTTLFWSLAATVFIAIIIMVVTFIIMRKKINRVKREQAEEELKVLKTLNNDALERGNHGELLWELKSRVKNPLEDNSMEFIINTSLRNHYKTFSLFGFDSNYEEETLIKLAKMKKVDNKSDITIINAEIDFETQFDNSYKELGEGRLLLLVNAPRKNKKVKSNISYLKTIGAKWEFQKYGKGIVLVTR